MLRIQVDGRETSVEIQLLRFAWPLSGMPLAAARGCCRQTAAPAASHHAESAVAQAAQLCRVVG